MPRSIWTGAISFGLVNVPVKLYSAVSKKTVRFHQLHETDGVRIQQKRVCPADGEEVAWDDIVKGYEISPDRYVVVTSEELEALDPKKTRTIDIEEFVELDEIDPLYYDHPYFLLPGQGATKPYKLLVTAMEKAGKVAIARVVIRTKEQLVAIRPLGEVLAMATMNFHDEVVDPESFDDAPGDDVETTKREVDMAEQLIESLTAEEFDPEKYHDTYREAVLDLIEKKAEGQEIVLQPAEEPEKVPDLMAALEASLAAAKKDGDEADAKKPRRRGATASNGSGGSKKSTAASGRGGRSKSKR
ncbi:MAG: Ku protein [Actinobacteria bacterium]|nr:Ku protein [Actinomycetota bacterium]